MKDLKGFTTGRLTVLSFSHKGGEGVKKRSYWNCVCSCGYKCVKRSDALTGPTESCGCLRLERATESNTKHGHLNNGSQTPEYVTWQNIKQRCKNVNKKCAKNYVEKGISVCSRWLNSFENFLSDMGPKPSPKHTIERRKNYLGYSPQNCYWATRDIQNRNHSRNIWIEHDGKRMVAIDWAKETGIPYPTITARFKRGLPAHQVLSTTHL